MHLKNLNYDYIQAIFKKHFVLLGLKLRPLEHRELSLIMAHYQKDLEILVL